MFLPNGILGGLAKLDWRCVARQAVSAALSTRGLDKSFGSLVVAKDIAFSLPQGARHALIGPNGAGKTTLINLMTGMLRPDAGEILLGDEDDHARSPPDKRVSARAGAHVPDQHAVPESERARSRDARGVRARGRGAHLVAAGLGAIRPRSTRRTRSSPR